jgi:hypothetical protein
VVRAWEVTNASNDDLFDNATLALHASQATRLEKNNLGRKETIIAQMNLGATRKALVCFYRIELTSHGV